MTTIAFIPMPTDLVRAYQAGALDANGQPPERAVVEGPGNPCRHCLREIPVGREMLILAHRPFPGPQPYAEIGPIFLCADACARWAGDGAPDLFTDWEALLVRGYDAEDRIVYGTGAVTPTDALTERAEELLQRPDVAYVHLRSARNNCFQARVERRRGGAAAK